MVLSSKICKLIDEPGHALARADKEFESIDHAEISVDALPEVANTVEADLAEAGPHCSWSRLRLAGSQWGEFLEGLALDRMAPMFETWLVSQRHAFPRLLREVAPGSACRAVSRSATPERRLAYLMLMLS